MEAADLLMNDTGIFSDGDSESDYFDESASISSAASVSPRPLRKFGTVLHVSLENRSSSQSSTEKALASSRFARKHVNTTKKKTSATHQKLSPHNGNGATPKPIKQARFSGSDVAPRTRSPEQSPLSTKRSEYTVNFEPGSIGLKLEPVLKKGKKEFGCRVMKLLSNGKGSTFPPQALKSGKINIGDVITAVNGKTVTSKSYKEIVSMLTSSGDRGVTFRIPRSPAPVMPTTSAATIHSSSGNAATGNAKSQREEVMKTSPARSNKSSIGEDSTTVFSSSFVNRMTRSTVKDTSIFYESKPLSNILSTVTKSVTPTISTIKPMHVASALSKQASQVFAGNSSKETEETNHIKMELLNELSKAKTLLGEQEANMLMMKLMLDIHREKVVIQTEKNILEDELSVAQNAQAVSESLLHKKGEDFKATEEEKSIKLERSQRNLEDITVRVNALAKQNGLLRAQNEQLKVQSNSKERDFTRQLTKATKEAKEADSLKKKASSLEKRLLETDRTLTLTLTLLSKELTDRTSFAEKTANGTNEKDAVLTQMRSTVEEMKYHAEEMGTSHQKTVTKLELKLTEMSEELNAWATEYGQIHEENAHLHSMLEGASMQIEDHQDVIGLSFTLAVGMIIVLIMMCYE